MEKVKVNLRKFVDRSYEILIGINFKEIVKDLKKFNYTSYVIITDSNVVKLYSKRINLPYNLITFKAGEKRKNIDTYKKILERLCIKNIDRKAVILALGGGVVGDVAGFVAATYMRGIDYIQIPTTLIAQVDSSVGGKVGVNLKAGKNLCGAFYQPKRVYVNVTTLKSLPKRELRSGLAEIIKYGVIADKELFNFVENNIKQIFDCEEKVLIKIIKRCCEIKAKIIEKDEKENNLRKILNYGHTVGHAIESLSNYYINHGEAISLGMIAEAYISNQLGYLSKETLYRIKAILKRAGLPIKVGRIKIGEIINKMKIDKKVMDKRIRFVLPQQIGKMKSVKGEYGITIEKRLIKEAISKILK